MELKQPILLMVTSQDWGGAQAYIYNLAKEIQSLGLPVQVCAGGSGELGERCRESGINFIQLKHMARDVNPIKNILSLFELYFLYKKLRPSAIHLNSSMMGFVGSIAARLAKVPRVIYVAHGWVFNEHLPAGRLKFYIWLEKFSARWKDKIICIHPKDEELARRLNFHPREKIITIPNGLDIQTHESALLERKIARQKLNLPEQSFVIGTVANAYPPKNLLWYLDVCNEAHIQLPSLRFSIIGCGPQMDELKTKHAQLGMESFVALEGRRLDAPTLYRAFDVFVLPSTKEGMSITLLEAMASKIPSIVTNVGANQWCLNGSGLIVDVNDKGQMIHAILKLAEDRGLRETLANHAYQEVIHRFEWKQTVEMTVRTLIPTL